MFGFNNLDSPLVLSPVTTSPNSASSYCSAESPNRSGSNKVVEKRRNPYRRLLGTYDVPIYKPATRKPPPRKKPKVEVRG